MVLCFGVLQIQSYIDKIRTLQNRTLKAIAFTNNDINTNTNHIYFDLKILNIDHQLQVQLSSLMWDYDHNTLPLSSLMWDYDHNTLPLSSLMWDYHHNTFTFIIPNVGLSS